MKISLQGLKPINNNPETGFVQYENKDKISWWMPEAFYDAYMNMDNLRRSRDYFRAERDDLKRHHEMIMENMTKRVEKVEAQSSELDKNLNSLYTEAAFLQDELQESERNVLFFKTLVWFLSFLSLAFFCLIIYASSH